MKKLRLNQVLAIEKGVKTRTYAEATRLHKLSSSSQAMNGFEKKYTPKEEGGHTYAPERHKVQIAHTEAIAEARAAWREMWNILATKDYANCEAKADVVVDGETLLEQVPATHLLAMEKQLTDVHAFVSKLIELDPGEAWTPDPNTGMHRTSPSQTHKTAKIQRPIVLYDATEEHPAQTQLITEDVVVGHWELVKYSGGIPRVDKRKLLARIDKLQTAIKQAREAANMIEVEMRETGNVLARYMFGDTP